MPVGSVQTIVVCTVSQNPCPARNQATVTGYLLDPAVSGQLQLLMDQGGIDWAVVEEIFGGGLLLFATGAGIGLFINVLRKLRL